MRRILAAGALIALVMSGGLTLSVSVAAAATGTNLILNPDAETGTCTTSGYDAMTLPGWVVTTGAADAVCYGASGFPSSGTAGPSNRGMAFFAGGATGDSTMTQTVSVASSAGAIDGGGVTYSLSGWLGGWSTQNDRVAVSAVFRNAAGARVGTAGLAAVTSTDRGNTTELLQRTASGAVPVGTRSIVVSLTFSWTSGSTTDGYADNLSLTLSTTVSPPTLTAPAASVPSFDHVFFAYMENENYSASEAPANSGDYIMGNPAAPYLNTTIAPQGALLSSMYATSHPSDPNYLAMSGGSTFGWSSNPTVGSDKINAPSLADTVEAAGKTWKGYADGMSGNCDTGYHNTASGGYYLPDDEPFMMYADVVNDAPRCAAHNQPLTRLSTDLQSTTTTPSFVWFAANDYQDMEMGGVSVGDTWLSRMLPQIFHSPAWTTQRSLLILSWDEGYSKSYGPAYPNHVATYVLASQGLVKAGYRSDARYTQFSLLRTVDAALGLSPLTSNDAYAAPLNDVWTGTGGGNTTGNLVVNGDAESGSCSTTGSGASNVTTGWSVSSGTPQQLCYGSSGFPDATQGPSAPDSPGWAFFEGGTTASARLSQTINISGYSSQIDTGTYGYRLSGWLGGYWTQDDNARVVATFRDSAGNALDAASLAPVLSAQRASTTGMLFESASGTLPAGTRSVLLELNFSRASGTDDDGYADDVSLVLG
jgi:phosphoesterase family protein